MSLSTIPAAPPIGTSRWELDPAHSHVEFAVKHLMISTVKGRFTDVRGTVSMHGSDPATATVDASILVASIDTQEAQRDTHLRSPDFFDAARFPVITFRSRRIQGDSLEGPFRLTGDLTMHGVTREVALDVTGGGGMKDMAGNERAGFSARTRIDRTDFGLGWNRTLEAGGVLVGTEVRIAIEVELVRMRAVAATVSVGSSA